MLKLLCPNCMKSVSVPDDAAGKDAPCPECGKPISVPARYYPVVGPTPMPPVPLPPPPNIAGSTSSVFAPNSPPPEALALPTGYIRARGFTISPCVVAWIPAVSLSLILVLTLVPWVGVYPGGHPVYTQSAWRAITGRPTQSFQLEELLLKELPAPSVYVRTSPDWLIMLPYILALLLAVALAWAERLNPPVVSKRLPGLWPYRIPILAVLAITTLLLLVTEATRGFGLERAMESAVNDKFEATRQAAGASPGDPRKIDFSQQRELAMYGLERTGWFCLVLCLHVLAVLAILGRFGLERRGSKPPPRIVLQY